MQLTADLPQLTKITVEIKATHAFYKNVPLCPCESTHYIMPLVLSLDVTSAVITKLSLTLQAMALTLA